MTSFALLIPIVAAFVWLLDRRDKRGLVEREATAVRMHEERLALEVARSQASPDLEALVALVRDLCQRVQAPKEAVVQHQMETGPVFAPPAVLPDDDAGWFEARMSKEDLARQAMDEELAARGAN